VGQMVSKVGGIGAEGKLELVQLMFEKPPSNVSTPITITSSYFIRKNGAQVRLETQHQNLWAGSIVPFPHDTHDTTRHTILTPARVRSPSGTSFVSGAYWRRTCRRRCQCGTWRTCSLTRSR
jgi:hypothetical protein